ncbi:MAG: pentapeptide repeat-containing protein, partial [Bacilli bacterium]
SLKSIMFSNCNLESIRIYENNFNFITFNNCNLTKSEIINTPLKDIDLSNCSILNMKFDLKEIDGLIVNTYQASDIARSLGLVIKE